MKAKMASNKESIESDFPRHMLTRLETALASYRIVYIVGPRQVGKTTLVKNLLNKGKYVNLDNDAMRAAIEFDPGGVIQHFKAEAGIGPVIIDEVQRSSDLSLTIKQVVDNDKRKGQFLLTGSSNIFTSMKVADSLPGRVVPFKLWPLTISEIRRKKPPQILNWALQKNPSLSQIHDVEAMGRKEYVQLILEGGFPEPRNLDIGPRQKQYRSYVDNIVERDLVDIMPLRKPGNFRKLIDQMAIRTAQEINQNELSNILDIKWETVKRYLDFMLRLSLVVRAPAWRTREAKRDIKNPKYHFVDSGMACALRRLDASMFDPGHDNSAQLGGLLESFVFNEILRILPYQDKDFVLYHWRSADHREIDILAEGDGQLIGMEVKSASSIAMKDFKHLKWFAANHSGKRPFTGILFYFGEHVLSLGDRCYALPVSTLWASFDL